MHIKAKTTSASSATAVAGNTAVAGDATIGSKSGGTGGVRQPHVPRGSDYIRSMLGFWGRQMPGTKSKKGRPRQELSPLGTKVADILGIVYHGLYHLPSKHLAKVEWDNDHFIQLNVQGTLATVDSNHLTWLVVFAHAASIRLDISAVMLPWSEDSVEESEFVARVRKDFKEFVGLDPDEHLGSSHLRLLFHQRQRKTGSFASECPSIDDAILSANRAAAVYGIAFEADGVMKRIEPPEPTPAA